MGGTSSNSYKASETPSTVRSPPSPRPPTRALRAPQRAPSPPPSPLMDTEWRKVGDLNKEQDSSLKSEVKSNETGYKKIRNARLLMLGPAGSGKSAFINTVASIDSDRISEPAMAGSDVGSLSKKLMVYRPHKLLKGFRLIDTMGVEESDGMGFHVSDGIAIIEGRVRPNYRFNPESPVSETDEAYVKNPKPKDQAQCVIFVMNSNNVYEGAVSEKIQNKIDTLQDEIKKIGVKRILILTNIDRLCDEVKKDLNNVFRSRKVKEAVEAGSKIFGIPEQNVFPVENYYNEVSVDPSKNVLALLALRQAVHFSSDYLRLKAEDEDRHSSSEEDVKD